MLVLTAEQVRAFAPIPRLIEALEQAFASDCMAPQRQVSNVPGGAGERLLLLMPAFDSDGRAAVKLATVFPDNSGRGLPSIHAAILMFAETGAPIALLDGTTVTRLRTGAASALASKYLSRHDSSHLAIIGTGALAPEMAAAHCTVRPIRRISIWGRRRERATAIATAIRLRVDANINLTVMESIEETVASADIVSCATSSSTPLVAGKWVRSGTFVDLVGSFSPAKREVDDDAVLRARVFVDTFDGALSEAGDLLDPLARGVIDRQHIKGELADLVSGRVTGRTNDEEITLFKSVGTAIEDFAAANLIVASAINGKSATTSTCQYGGRC